MTVLKLTGELVDAGILNGTEVKVEIDADDVLEAVDADGLWPIDEDEDPLFQRMSDWDRAELKRAVTQDDGRRVIDILKRAAA